MVPVSHVPQFFQVQMHSRHGLAEVEQHDPCNGCHDRRNKQGTNRDPQGSTCQAPKCEVCKNCNTNAHGQYAALQIQQYCWQQAHGGALQQQGNGLRPRCCSKWVRRKDGKKHVRIAEVAACEVEEVHRCKESTQQSEPKSPVRMVHFNTAFKRGNCSQMATLTVVQKVMCQLFLAHAKGCPAHRSCMRPLANDCVRPERS
mmetsp:Transcript_97429/g.270991  ORF Transcript_97429/g.270991 Transcript_97429/m.270991 type:complete len:201 (-) Transcript_97429:39-641(-)